MTHEEAETIILDILTEYLPKTITKALKKEVIGEILRELNDQEALTLEETVEEDEDSPEEEDLVSLMRK